MSLIPTYGYGSNDGTNLVAAWGYGESITATTVFDLVEFTLTLCRVREFDLER